MKGVGREHAKWSPVATAWYRLHPEVVLLQPVAGADAEELAAAVPGLFEVKDGQLVVGQARQHEDKLEKVGGCGLCWVCGGSLHAGTEQRRKLLRQWQALVRLDLDRGTSG